MVFTSTTKRRFLALWIVALNTPPVLLTRWFDETRGDTVSTFATAISYVIEPFEPASNDFFTQQHPQVEDTRFKFNTTNDTWAGHGALRVEYFDRAEKIHNAEGTSYVEFGSVIGEGEGIHNCHGATHFSLKYKFENFSLSAGHVELRVFLIQDSIKDSNPTQTSKRAFLNSTDNMGQPETQVVQNTYVVWNGSSSDTFSVSEGYWQELLIGIRSDNSWILSDGSNVSDKELAIERIQGWKIELSVSNSAEISGMVDASLVVLFDQFECVGGGKLLGAAFHNGGQSFSHAVSKGVWYENYFQSPYSKNFSSVSLVDGKLNINYTVEQTESWGGFLVYEHVAPEHSYYNLSQADAVLLHYEVTVPASVTGRANFRIILIDESDCRPDCRIGNYESYYSFHHFLDSSTSGKTRNITVMLEGSSNSSSPFWRTGWTGGVGNNMLDREHIKGFRLEVNIDSQGEVGSLVTGSFSVENFSAVNSGRFEDSEETRGGCVHEPDVLLGLLNSPSYTRIEFTGSKECCEMCEASPDCLYFSSSIYGCDMAPDLNVQSIGLLSTKHKQPKYQTYWTDDSKKRGDFCDVCTCNKASRTIDCRGKDLAIVPKAFSPREKQRGHDDDNSPSWTPRVLDLSGNPRLLLLGSRALESVAESIEELVLPLNIQFISPECIQNLPRLAVVRYGEIDIEGDSYRGKQGIDHNVGDTSILNVIMDPTGSFGDVCCSRGTHVSLSSPSSGLTFCEMHTDEPGIDSLYEPFIRYVESHSIREFRPSSSFMAEAAESPELCAEYCALTEGCMYFGFDARLQNSENICTLLENNGTRAEEVCCSADDYADAERRLPGWTSGRPPRTRHKTDGAAVSIAPLDLVLDQSNGYTAQFTVALGSTPLRGSVWVEPLVSVVPPGLNVSISTSRVALYDDTLTGTIEVSILNAEAHEMGEKTFVIANSIKSCDKAFTAGDSGVLTAQNTVYCTVIFPLGKHETSLLAVLIPCCVFVLVLAVVRLYIQRRIKQADSVWTVKLSELHFEKPPKVAGRGTFGLVLLAEYRGTEVAVKRVIPPKFSTSRLARYDRRTGSVFDADVDFDENGSGANLASTRSAVTFSRSTSESFDTWSEQELETANQSRLSRFQSLHTIGFQSGLFKWNMSRNKSARRLRLRLKKDFITEMRHLSKLRHPCITTVMGAVIERKEEPMLVMEYMDLGSLHDILHDKNMIIDGKIMLPILRDMAQGMRFLHAATPHVIHGDLKSHNVLVDRKFRAKVADFGFSQKKQVGATGTVFWMAPELLRGEKCNSTMSDVYSFGIILCEIYSRRDPYEGEAYQSVLRLVSDPNVKKRPYLPSSCPVTVARIVDSCLSHDPASRPTFLYLDELFKGFDVAQVDPGKENAAVDTAEDWHADDAIEHSLGPQRHVQVN